MQNYGKATLHTYVDTSDFEGSVRRLRGVMLQFYRDLLKTRYGQVSVGHAINVKFSEGRI